MLFARNLSVVSVVGITLLVSGCGGGSSSMSQASSAPAAAETAVPAEPAGITYELTCYSEDGDPTLYADLEEAWSEPNNSCGADYVSGEPSEGELAAIEVYGYADDPRYLDFLYGPCAETAGKYITEPLRPDEVKMIKGALMVCPDHPKRAQLEANIKAGLAKEAADDAAIAAEIKANDKNEAERASGKYVDDGKFLVGKDVVPGTWQSQGAKVEECYWEVSDAQGNIIENNYINVAPQFTIQVPATAAGFTVSGCTFRWIGA